MLTTPLKNTGGPVAHVFVSDINGQINYQAVPSNPPYYLPVSNCQYVDVSKGCIYENKSFFDAYVRDYVYQPGLKLGGIHGGEPIPINSFQGTASSGPSYQTAGQAVELDSPQSITFPLGPSSGAERTSYVSQSIAVEIRFRLR